MALSQTEGFGKAAQKVFSRLVLGKGPGLMILWGGMPGDMEKTNKSYFLDLVEALSAGPEIAKPYVPDYVWEILRQLEPNRYQCIRIKEDSGLDDFDLYASPLSTLMPIAIARAAGKHGIKPGRDIIVICDELEKYIPEHKQMNERFLLYMSITLNGMPIFLGETSLTFLGAAKSTWDANSALGGLASEDVLTLGPNPVFSSSKRKKNS
jgi:hypothetical protein